MNQARRDVTVNLISIPATVAKCLLLAVLACMVILGVMHINGVHIEDTAAALGIWKPAKDKPATPAIQAHKRIYMLTSVSTQGSSFSKAQGVEIWCVDGHKVAWFDGDRAGGAVAMMVWDGGHVRPARCEE